MLYILNIIQFYLNKTKKKKDVMILSIIIKICYNICLLYKISTCCENVHKN